MRGERGGERRMRRKLHGRNNDKISSHLNLIAVLSDAIRKMLIENHNSVMRKVVFRVAANLTSSLNRPRNDSKTMPGTIDVTRSPKRKLFKFSVLEVYAPVIGANIQLLSKCFFLCCCCCWSVRMKLVFFVLWFASVFDKLSRLVSITMSKMTNIL